MPLQLAMSVGMTGIFFIYSHTLYMAQSWEMHYCPRGFFLQVLEFCQRQNSNAIKKDPYGSFFMATSPGGVALHSQTSCLLIPGRRRASRCIHAPALSLSRLAPWEFLQKRSGSTPPKAITAWSFAKGKTPTP
jgi:hypothetical protein